MEEVPQRETRTVVEVPCLICCSTLKAFAVEKEAVAKKDKEYQVFRWFLSNFKKTPKGQELFSTRRRYLDGKMKGAWDGKWGMSEPLKFCGDCNDGILEWIGTRMGASYDKEKRKWMRMTRKRMRECEDEFEKKEIYKKDMRYFNVRRKIIKIMDSDVVQPVKEKLKKAKEKKKKIKIQRKSEDKRLFEKNEMDRILGEGFREMGAEQGAPHQQQLEEVFMKMDEEEEREDDWEWEDDWEGEDEEEEPPIIHVRGESRLEMDPLGLDTDTGVLEVGNHEVIEVKPENNLEHEVFEEDRINAVHLENIDFDETMEPHRNCLLCYKGISKEESALAPVLTNDLYEQNFNTVFILRKMLNVPKGRLVGYLEKFGCPGKWVEYCKNCLGLVDQSLRIQKEISELEIKLRKCQEKIVLRIKTTCKKSSKNGSQERREKLPNEITRITEETRKFFNNSQGTKLTKKMNKNGGSEDKVSEIKSNTGRMFLKTLKNGVYTCSLCPNLTLTKPMSFIKFYRHVIFHSQRPFRCSICNVYWSSVKELEKNPFVKENPSNEHVCTEATLVKIPNGKFNPGKIWKCKWCPEKFEMETERDSHEDEEHSSVKTKLEMKYKCLSCSQGYRTFREWLLHRVLEHPEVAAVSCLFCDVTAFIPTNEGIDIINSVEMKKHVTFEHSSCENLFVSHHHTCDFCGIPFTYARDELTRHIKDKHKLNSGNCTYSCPCCHHRTDQLRSLKIHFKLRHSFNQQIPARLDSSWSPPSSPPDIGSPEAEPTDLKPSSTKKLKLSTDMEVSQQNANSGEKYLEYFKKEEYTCPFCPTLKHMSLAKFYRHIIFHTKRPLKCSTCNVYWSSVKELEKNPFVKENPLTDHTCTEKTLVKIPDGKFNPGKIWSCNWCPGKFDSDMERDSHEEKEHSSEKVELEMKYKCLSCSQAYRNYPEWLIHRAMEHPKVALISCLFCDFTAVIQTKEGIDVENWIDMRTHVSLEHSVCKDLYVSHANCDFCGISFKYGRGYLACHIKDTHQLTSGQYTYSCPCCHYRTDQLRNLRIHLKLHHSLLEHRSLKRKRCAGKLKGITLEEARQFSSLKPVKKRTKIVTQVEPEVGSDAGSDNNEPLESSCPPDDPDSDNNEVLELSSQSCPPDNLDLGSGEKYACSLCPTIEQPMSLGKFYRHVIFHTKRPYSCSVCNVHWSSVKELEKNPFVKENPLSEHVCSEATLVRIPTEGKFNPGKIWSCNWCSVKFEMETERDLHEDEEHSSLKTKLEMKYKCLSCSQAYRSFKEWLLHRVFEHPQVAGISCIFCDFTAVIKTKDGMDVFNWVEMGRHVNSEHKANRQLFFGHLHFCDFCGMTFRYGADDLARHIKEDHKLTSGKSTHGCPCCPYRSERLKSMRSHLILQHSLTPRPPSKKPGYLRPFSKLMCDICGRSLQTRLVLVDHKMVKHGVEPEEMEEYTGQEILKCEKGDECGGFRTLVKASMRDHMMKKHGAERTWKCDQCGKGFTDSNHLRRHKEIHRNKGLRPYQCEICGNSFAVKNYLYIHKRLSHQNRPFASTNRKRTPKGGTSRLGGINTAAESEASGPTSVPAPQPAFPPTQGATARDSSMESVNFNNNDRMDSL